MTTENDDLQMEPLAAKHCLTKVSIKLIVEDLEDCKYEYSYMYLLRASKSVAQRVKVTS